LAGLAASVVVALASTAASAAPGDDPIFALIDAHKLAQAQLKAAEAAHGAAERDFQAPGLLFPEGSPSEQAMDEAYQAALETLDIAVVPATVAGVMALLELQRDLWEFDVDLFDKGHCSLICESIETALQNLQTAS